MSHIEQEAVHTELRDLCLNPAGFDQWFTQYLQHLKAETQPASERIANMNRINPKFVLRKHLAWQAIDQAGMETYADLPPDWAKQLEISCSS